MAGAAGRIRAALSQQHFLNFWLAGSNQLAGLDVSRALLTLALRCRSAGRRSGYRAIFDFRLVPLLPPLVGLCCLQRARKGQRLRGGLQADDADRVLAKESIEQRVQEEPERILT